MIVGSQDEARLCYKAYLDMRCSQGVHVRELNPSAVIEMA